MENIFYHILSTLPAIKAMHGPHSVVYIGHRTVIDCDTELTNEKQRKTNIRLTDQSLDVSSNR